MSWECWHLDIFCLWLKKATSPWICQLEIKIIRNVCTAYMYVYVKTKQGTLVNWELLILVGSSSAEISIFLLKSTNKKICYITVIDIYE